MQSYIGTKIIKAVPMSDEEFYAEKAKFEEAESTVRVYKAGYPLFRRGGELGAESGGRPPKPREGYKVMYPDGYISWSPKEAFETAYRLITEAEQSLIR